MRSIHAVKNCDLGIENVARGRCSRPADSGNILKASANTKRRVPNRAVLCLDEESTKPLSNSVFILLTTVILCKYTCNWSVLFQNDALSQTLAWKSGVSLKSKASLWMSMQETFGQKLTPRLGKALLTYLYHCWFMQSGRKLLALSELFPIALFPEMRMKKFSTLAGNLMNVITGIP